MDRFLTLLAFATSAFGAIFDFDGNVLADGAYDSPDVGWYLVWSNDTRWNGVHTFIPGQSGPRYCSGTFIKTWQGRTPPSNTPAYGISSSGCFIDYTNETAVSLVYLNYSSSNFFLPGFANPRVAAIVDTTIDIPGRSRRTANITEFIPFMTFNQTDMIIYQFNAPALTLWNAGFRFYPIAPSLPDLDDDIVSVTHFDPIAANGVFNLRTAYGKFKGRYAYTVDFTKIQVDGLAFAATYASSGAPVFDKNYRLVTMGSILDSSVNAGPNLVDLRNCFDIFGVWNYTLTGCLQSWKEKMYTTYRTVQAGYSPPVELTALDKPPRSNITIVSGITDNYASDQLVAFNNLASLSTLIGPKNINDLGTLQGYQGTLVTVLPSSAVRGVASVVALFMLSLL